MSELFKNIDITSGLKSPDKRREKISDDEAYKEAVKISDICQKISYLRNIVDEKTPYHIKSKRYLAELIKDIEPEHACRLLFSICKMPAVCVEDYISISNIFIHNEAWSLAKQVLETARIICPDQHESLQKIETDITFVNDKISKNETDKSKKFENIPFPDKSWFIEKLYLRGDIAYSAYYALRLLNKEPDNINSYQIVINLFTRIENTNLFKALINNLKQNTAINNEHKNLFLGIAHYNLNNIEQSIIYFLESLKHNSKNEQSKTYLALSYLIKGNITNFIKTTNDIQLNKNFTCLAVCFLSYAFEGKKLNSEPLNYHETISTEISKIINKLIQLKQMYLVQFLIERFNFLNYQSPLPYINLYLAETFIKHKLLDIAKELLKIINNNEEVHRLYSWIYNLEGKKDLAQEELRKYTEKTLIDFKNNRKPVRFQLMNVSVPSKVPSSQDEILKLMSNAYEEAKKIIEEMCFEYGINKMTCKEASCQDCCIKTFPVISYTEYLYMRNWLDKQGQKFKRTIMEKSKKITNDYKSRYNKEPEFFKDSEPHNYPVEFEFTCPFLGDNKCNVYEARPFVCRMYGFGSYDGNQLNGCNYFTGQITSGNKLINIKKVVNMSSFIKLVSLTDKSLIQKKVAAPIPFWFSHTHEEIVEIVSKL